MSNYVNGLLVDNDFHERGYLIGGRIMTDNLNTIPPDKHVLVCGMTGTGKSFLCENYLRNYKYVVKLDTKDETSERRANGLSPWQGLEENVDFTVTNRLTELDDIDTDKIIYVPDYDEQNETTFNQFFRWIFERGNTILWIDELMSIGSVQSFPKELGRLMQQGRSKGCGVWSCTQRPSGIPSCVPSNTTYFFVFDMALPQDRKKLVETTGMMELSQMPTGYNFWYYKMGDRKCVKARLTV